MRKQNFRRLSVLRADQLDYIEDGILDLKSQVRKSGSGNNADWVADGYANIFRVSGETIALEDVLNLTEDVTIIEETQVIANDKEGMGNQTLRRCCNCEAESILT